MKDSRFEALLHAARPHTAPRNTEFTDKVMSSIKSHEIFSAHVRNMSVNKKETLFMKFRHLPKFAIIAIALGALLLVSGGAYAAYQLLWQKPEVHVSEPTTSVSGREEVVISLAQCGDGAGLGSRYELKKNATIRAEDVPKVLEARCELAAINTWAQKAFLPEGYRAPFHNDREYDALEVYVASATHIKTRDVSSITFEGQNKYNLAEVTIHTPSSVRYIADGKEVTSNDISSNDPVVYITKSKTHMVPQNCTPQHCSIQPTELSKELVAVVKLSLPFEYYDQLAWQSLTERQVCMGNPSDSCLTGYSGAIDIYVGSAQVTNQAIMKEIQGVITAIEGKTITLRSSSGSTFTVTTPTDAVSIYNTNKANQYYDGKTVKVGSSVSITYAEDKATHSKNIQAKDLMYVQLKTEVVSKGDKPSAY